MIVLVIRSSIIITCREGCWHNRHSMFWTSSSLLRQCQTLVGILIIFCHLSVHLFRFFWMIPPNLYDDILAMTMVTMTKMTPLYPRWQRRSYCESSFLTSLSHSSLMQVIIIEEINTPSGSMHETQYLQNGGKSIWNIKTCILTFLALPRPAHRIAAQIWKNSGLGWEIVNRLLIISDC